MIFSSPKKVQLGFIRLITESRLTQVKYQTIATLHVTILRSVRLRLYGLSLFSDAGFFAN